jgi:hypothetical protein
VLPHAVVGSQRYPRSPVVFSNGELPSPPAPTRGQHTVDALRDAGIDESTIAAALAELAAGEEPMSRAA